MPVLSLEHFLAERASGLMPDVAKLRQRSHILALGAEHFGHVDNVFD
ncbi:hypothetical protein ACVWWI_006485 [Bradyrhizobium sp. USDA 3686]|nr:hypothetical protein [Bradyrhizobium canariense]